MRAVVVHAPFEVSVVEVPDPVPGPGEVVVDVERVGVCGTDVELVTGEMPYLRDGSAVYPLRPGHEWAGVVRSVGPGVPGYWRGRRVTGEVTLGCEACPRCEAGRRQVCADRVEVGLRGALPGALAERVVVPVRGVVELPDQVDAVAGALVEPGANALRAAEATGARAGEPVLVAGTGTIGLLVASHLRARGVRVVLAGQAPETTTFARSLELAPVVHPADLTGATVGRHGTGRTGDSGGGGDVDDRRFAAVVDATSGAEVPARLTGLVEPGGRVVLVGLAGSASLVDTRDVVLGDLTVVGILGAHPRTRDVVDAYATGVVDPRVVVATTVDLDTCATLLVDRARAGSRPPGGGAGPPAGPVAPKTLVDPAASRPPDQPTRS